MILIREFNQILNFTFSAAFAISNIPCDLDLTVKILNAVRKEDQKFFGPDPVSVRSDEMIVQFDERLLDSLFGYTDYLSHQNHEGEEDFRNNASQLMRQENVLSSQYGEDKQQTAKDHEEDQRGEGKTEDRWEGGMNVFQSNDGNIPEEKDEKEEYDTGKD
jgi:hypothetical protein